MPIYISHSPNDKQIADELVIQLARHNVNIWIDQWQLAKDDSMTNKIQEDLHGTSALLVILSKESTETEWCRNDLSPALLRELEDKNVVVMPVMVEDCYVPEFARDKLFADFRTDCDDGLCTIIENIARITNPMKARVIQHNYSQDWGVEWRIVNDRLSAKFIFVLMHQTLSFSCIVTILMQGNQVATKMYSENKAANGAGAAKLHVAETLYAHFSRTPDVMPMISEVHDMNWETTLNGRTPCEVYSTSFSICCVGNDPGRDIPVDLKGLVERTFTHMCAVHRH